MAPREGRMPVWFGDLDQALHFLWTAKFSLDDLAAADRDVDAVLHEASASVTRAIESLASLLEPRDRLQPLDNPG